MAEIQSLPERSLSATLKKRWLFFFKSDLNAPKFKMINTSSLTLFSDIINLIKHGNSRDTDLIKHQLSIVDPIEAHLPAHVFNSDTFICLHPLVPYWHYERVNSLIFPFHQCLCKHYGIVSMTSPVCDPILL